MNKEMKFWLSLLGYVASVAAVISLASQMFKVGLVPIAAEFIEYYRAITQPPIDILLAWVPIKVPSWYHDAAVLSFICTLINQRAKVQYSEEKKLLVVPEKPYFQKMDPQVVVAARWIVYGVTGAVGVIVYTFTLVGLSALSSPIFSLLSVLFPQSRGRLLKHVMYDDIIHRQTVSIFFVTVASLAFFVLNYQIRN